MNLFRLSHAFRSASFAAVLMAASGGLSGAFAAPAPAAAAHASAPGAVAGALAPPAAASVTAPGAATGATAPGAATSAIPAGSAPDTTAPVPAPDVMATQPDARDFITRSDIDLSAQGNPLRFAGVNISWLGLRSDTGLPQDGQFPTQYETDDAMKTAQAMGVGYIRVASLLATAGCALCLTPAPGQINPVAQSHIDHLLRMARDAGLKIIVPLAGSGQCAATGPIDPVAGTQCFFARARGLPGAAFYSNAGVRADFVQHIVSLLNHVNPETGLAWKDAGAIMAWENCDGCGNGVDTAVLADWTEFLGRALKAIDPHHLYENGAFAGRLVDQKGVDPKAIPDPAKLALPSVDIVGDRLFPTPGSAPNFFVAAQQTVTQSGRIYIIDSYGWAPAQWTTESDLQAFFTELERDRAVAGAFASDLGGHADQGGWLPPTRPGEQMLYFPAAPTKDVNLAEMAPRARAVRRLSYGMMDLEPLAFASPDAPKIISVKHGKIVWRGATGATDYSIERSADITQTGSWDTVCDRCVTDASPQWQDNSVPQGKIWYRMTPYNSNQHVGLPSDPVQNQ